MNIKKSGAFNNKEGETIEQTILMYHGCIVPFDKIDLDYCNPNTDFSKGFYLTKDKEQALRWAKRNCKEWNKNDLHKKLTPIIQIYQVNMNYKTKSNYKVFPLCDDEWKNFILKCRTGTLGGYATVEGKMADKKIEETAVEVMLGKITFDQGLAKMGTFDYDTHQLSFHTKESLKYVELIEREEFSE